MVWQHSWTLMCLGHHKISDISILQCRWLEVHLLIF